MNLLFMQLPLIDHGYNYTAGNIPYAPALLCSFIRNAFPQNTCSYIPMSAANIMSSGMIVEYVIKKNPDIVSFSTYLWNAEVNLFIAQQLRERKKDLTIIFGGPEIQKDSFLFEEQRPVDFFVSGEGEWFYEQILSGRDISSETCFICGNRLITQNSSRAELSVATEPFTAGMIESSKDHSIFIEMTRGCPYACCYCNYSKNSRTVRERDFNTLLKAVEDAQKRDIRSIYILSPTFNSEKDFKDKLEALAGINKKVSLHTEIRADTVDSDTAAAIKRAGFESVETGLQTLTLTARRKIGRTGDPEDEIRGIKELCNAGISVKAGIIPGLPGDTKEGICAVIDRLTDEGLGDALEIYPLMVLPGTRMREMAAGEKIAYQTKPPYLFLHGPGFGKGAISEVYAYADQKTGVTSTVSRMPDFTKDQMAKPTAGSVPEIFKGFIRGMNIDASSDCENISDYIETNLFSLFLRNCSATELIEKWIEKVSRIQQGTLFHIIAYNDVPFDDRRITLLLRHLSTDNFHARLNVHTHERFRSKILIHQVTSSARRYWSMTENYETIIPVLRLADQDAVIISCAPPRVLVPEGLYDRHSGDLAIYADFPDMIAFESADERDRFNRETGAALKETAPHTRLLFIQDGIQHHMQSETRKE